MGKIFVNMAASLDGYIASADGNMAWLNNSMDKNEDYGFAQIMTRTCAYILGANTYREAMKYANSDDKTKTYVVTNDKHLKKAGENVEFFSGDLSKLAGQVKSDNSKDVWLYGGANLIHQFINLGLVDEISISVIPVLLGDGIRFFGKSDGCKKLKLNEVKNFKSGIVILNYSCE